VNILLVYPQYPKTFWSFKDALKFISRKAAFPPLGLLTIASMLPPGWAKKLVDENVTPVTEQHLRWADLVFVSAMIVQEDSARAIIARVKALGKRVVAGGPLFSSQPDRFPEVDHLVLGEAEITLPMFLDDWAEGKPKARYVSATRPDITATPLPMWSLVRFRDYATPLVQYSRGCPFDCEFCDITVMNGRKPRVKTPEQMLAEFQAIYERGWRGTVFVVDDNFIGNKREVKKMLLELITWQKEHRYPFKLFTEASVNLSEDEELMRLMSLANFGDIFLGLETPCMDSLREAGKTQNASQDLKTAVVKLQRHGLHVMGGFMVGFDHDNPQTIFQEQLRFIQEVGVPVAMIGTVMALPGTRLWHRLREEGRLLKESSGNNTTGETNFAPAMGMANLVDGYRQLLLTLYSAKNYFARIETLVKNYRSTIVSTHVPWNELLAMVRSMWTVGVRSKARWWYWRVLLRTVITNIRAFPVVVKLSIYWIHFRNVALSAQKTSRP
jgi:radical SAM superfamily enzyme YgiQ (UPF0313 family)